MSPNLCRNPIWYNDLCFKYRGLPYRWTWSDEVRIVHADICWVTFKVRYRKPHDSRNSSRKSFLFGSIKGCNCARNVIAHIRKQLIIERIKDDLQRLQRGTNRLDSDVRERALVYFTQTHTWFAPLGARNQEAAQRATTTARPTKTAYLKAISA